MPDLQLPLIKGDRHSNLDYRDLLPENFTSVSRSIKGDEGYLLSHDGLTKLSDTSGVCRGGTYNERFNKHFRVSGDSLEEVMIDGSVNVIGSTPGRDTASFANSFNTQAILSGGKLYYYDDAKLERVVDPDLAFPIDMAWFRGVFVFTDGEYLYHSSIGNEKDFSSLKYSSSEFSTDQILGLSRNDQNQILAFNRFSIEYFIFNANASPGTSVLQVISGKTIKMGIVGTHCKTELDGLFFILGGRKDESTSVHVISAGQSTTVASREVDKIISKYDESQLQKVVLESRVVDRDKFLIVHLPDETLIYNHTVASKFGVGSAWSYVKTGIDTSSEWRGIHGVFDFRSKRWIYGDKIEGVIGYLDQEKMEQYGEAQECICYTPTIPLETFSIDEIEIQTIPGYATSDINSFMSLSYNGVSFGQEAITTISKPLEYSDRYGLRRLGYVRKNFSIKFRIPSKNKVCFADLKVKYS